MSPIASRHAVERFDEPLRAPHLYREIHFANETAEIRATCKTTFPSGIIRRVRGEDGGAGGHFWHDAVIDANTITAAK